MTFNLLLWKWSAEFETPAKRKKLAVKFADISSQFTVNGAHPAIGEADIMAFRRAIDAEFGSDEDNRLFVFEDYGKCAVINGPNAARLDLISKVAGIGKRFGLNASEF